MLGFVDRDTCITVNNFMKAEVHYTTVTHKVSPQILLAMHGDGRKCRNSVSVVRNQTIFRTLKQHFTVVIGLLNSTGSYCQNFAR